MTAGIGLVLTNAALLIFSPNYFTVLTAYSKRNRQYRKISVSLPLLWDFLICFGITGILYLFIMKTDTGCRFGPWHRTLIPPVSWDQHRQDHDHHLRVGAALVGAAGALFMPIFYVFRPSANSLPSRPSSSRSRGMGSALGALVAA